MLKVSGYRYRFCQEFLNKVLLLTEISTHLSYIPQNSKQLSRKGFHLAKV